MQIYDIHKATTIQHLMNAMDQLNAASHEAYKMDKSHLCQHIGEVRDRILQLAEDALECNAKPEWVQDLDKILEKK